jgi:two-component system response regulator YesN
VSDMKLLIADRDKNECIGINWLITSYSLPINNVLILSDFMKVIEIIENEMPEMACIELDMIPKECWKMFKETVKRYVKKMILMTTEATFDRAMQAIEIQAIDLWIKPNSPGRIKNTIQRCLQELAAPTSDAESYRNNPNNLSYHSLFLESETDESAFRLWVLQTESRQKIKDLCAFLTDYEFQYRPVILPLSDVIVCIFHEEIPDLKQEGYRLLRIWEEEYGEPLVIVVDTGQYEKKSLHKKYMEAKKALQLTFLKGFRQIIETESNNHWISIDPFLTPSEQREWIEMLNKADKDKIKSWLYEEFLQFNEPYPEPGLLRTRLTSILAQIRRFMKTFHLQKDHYEKHYLKIFDTILYNPVLYRIVQDLLLFIFEVLEGVEIQKNLSRLDVVEQAILYIENNFADRELCLEDVAHHIDRNPAYVSHLISHKQGISFRQLLTDIRLREAKRLLTETNMSVQEIAYKTGFNNSNYFSRMFKEKTGISPRTFRQKKET